jgi:hypothetical protein
MKTTASIIEKLSEDWIPLIYGEKVRPQRTRSFELKVPDRENKVEILHTLLGIELKAAKLRISCPDLATARYLQVFARLGCGQVAVPYDITKISLLADELEVAWQRMILLLEKYFKQRSPQEKGKARASLIRQMRSEIKAIGAGEAMPLFDQSTRQREI